MRKLKVHAIARTGEYQSQALEILKRNRTLSAQNEKLSSYYQGVSQQNREFAMAYTAQIRENEQLMTVIACLQLRAGSSKTREAFHYLEVQQRPEVVSYSATSPRQRRLSLQTVPEKPVVRTIPQSPPYPTTASTSLYQARASSLALEGQSISLARANRAAPYSAATQLVQSPQPYIPPSGLPTQFSQQTRTENRPSTPRPVSPRTQRIYHASGIGYFGQR